MVKPLEPPDSHHLLAAQGWAELGNFAEADAELKNIAPAWRAHPQVLAVRYEIYAWSHRWDLAAEVAEMLVGAFADHASAWVSLAYAVRRKTGGGISQAREILTKARSLFPAERLIPYNLACYDCQLGDEAGALQWLRQAIALGNKQEIKQMALKDMDLQPLWAAIGGL